MTVDETLFPRGIIFGGATRQTNILDLDTRSKPDTADVFKPDINGNYINYVKTTHTKRLNISFVIASML